MIRPKPTCLIGGLLLACLVARAPAAETFDEAMQKTLLDYGERQRAATTELNATRTKIAEEKVPLLRAMRAAEDRVIAAQTAITRRETEQAQAQDSRQRLIRDAEKLQRNRAYLNSQAQDGLKAFVDGSLPAEDSLLADPLRALQKELDETPDSGQSGRAAVDALEFLQARLELSLGGYAVPGRAKLDGDNRILRGTFAFVGPQVYFQAETGPAGIAQRRREGEPEPVAYRLPSWQPADVAAFFQGKPAAIPADATGGKALRLKETRGTLLEHINKGGVVAYAIVAVGLVALILILQKVCDVMRMRVDEPEARRPFLEALADGEPEPLLGSLRSCTRELYVVGLAHRHRAKDVLEEHLQSTLLRQRLFFERRLPLLAVIATAAPLMGLLGTVIGMVRTFALITVFGTGNAGKLAGGISEVLVATELGLMVAIPTLVAHGFLAHRVQKNMATLERCALEFVTAAKGDAPVDADEREEVGT